jgi:Flp pilus assembly protein TadB
MDESQPSLLSRAVAVVVLLIVAVIAIRLAFGFVAGLISAVLWLAVVAALVVGVVWARRTLKGGRRPKQVEQPSPSLPAGATHEDRVAFEMEKIREELRRQGRS